MEGDRNGRKKNDTGGNDGNGNKYMGGREDKFGAARTISPTNKKAKKESGTDDR